MIARNEVFLSMVALIATLPLAAQQQVWRIDAPSQGPFGEHLAVIGDKDGDGHDDIVTTVYVPISPGSTNLIAEVWFYSGRTGLPIGQGRRNLLELARAGDANGDGVADYVISGAGQSLPACAPWQCVGIEVRSGQTDAVLWTADMFPYAGMGRMLLGDLDLDGDSRPDVIVGSNQAPFGGVLNAFSNGGQLLYQVLCAQGENFAPGLGKFIDFNGDGRDDFLLGIYEPTGRGCVDIRSGADGSQLRRIYGVPPILWGHGATAAMIGDLDGDHVPDIVSGDSGPGTPGVLEVLSSITGNLIHRWQVNTVGGDDFGWPDAACLDVDRDGVDDVVANARGGPIQNAGTYVLSGRDGTLIKRYPASSGGTPAGRVAALPSQTGMLFREYVCRGATSISQSIFMFSGSPQGVMQTGAAGQGTLGDAPRIGVRQFDPSGFRITLSGAEPSAPTFLVVGFSQPALPYFNLPTFGFQGCTLFPYPDLVGFTITGNTGLTTGYSSHDLSRQLLASPIPGLSYTIYAQWVTLGQGPTWPGGVSEAVRLHFR